VSSLQHCATILPITKATGLARAQSIESRLEAGFGEDGWELVFKLNQFVRSLNFSRTASSRVLNAHIYIVNDYIMLKFCSAAL
jgi:hypothetical protein